MQTADNELFHNLLNKFNIIHFRISIIFRFSNNQIKYQGIIGD